MRVITGLAFAFLGLSLFSPTARAADGEVLAAFGNGQYLISTPFEEVYRVNTPDCTDAARGEAVDIPTGRIAAGDQITFEQSADECYVLDARVKKRNRFVHRNDVSFVTIGGRRGSIIETTYRIISDDKILFERVRSKAPAVRREETATHEPVTLDSEAVLGMVADFQLVFSSLNLYAGPMDGKWNAEFQQALIAFANRFGCEIEYFGMAREVARVAQEQFPNDARTPALVSRLERLAAMAPAAPSPASAVSPGYRVRSGAVPGTRAMAGELMLYGGPGHKQFLGCVTCSSIASESVWNELGQFGSEFSRKSIRNTFGPFGGKFSSTSACNEFASDPPVVVDSEGGFYGYFTANTARASRISRPDLLEALEALCDD